MYDALSAIDIVERVTVLNIQTELDLSKERYLDGYNFLVLNQNNLKYVREQFDLIITLGAVPPKEWVDSFKQKESNKVVIYKGGNEFINQIEMILYGQFKGWPGVDINSKTIVKNYTNADEIWMVPQQEFHNKDYFEIAYKTKSRVAPFVWSPKFIEKSANLIKTDNPTAEAIFDNKKFDKWRLVSIEPNMGVLKNMMPIINYVEYAYRNMSDMQKESFEKLIITNAAGHKSNKELMNTIHQMDIIKANKVAIDARFPIMHLLSSFAEIVVSHQWGNALNYAYLDVCYYGVPLIHNAHLCQDLGYYYEDWKLKDAGDLIIKVMEERKSDITYMNRQREIIKRYTIENLAMLESYKKLLLNLWSNDLDKTTYDWKTNTIS